MASKRRAKGTKRKNKLSPRPRAEDVPVAVDASLKKLWDGYAKKLASAGAAGASAFDVVWETARKVVEHEPALYTLGGYKSAAEFFQQHLKTDPRTATRNMRVAKWADPAEEETYGVTNLDAALRWLEAKYGELEHRLPVAFDKLKIEVERDGEGVLVPFAELTAVDIDRATRRLRDKGGKSAASGPRRQLEKALAEEEALAGVRVTLRGERAGFSGVPLAEIARFAKALQAVKFPPRASRRRVGHE